MPSTALGEENGGTFVDGAYLSTSAVMELAELPPRERQQRIDEARRTGKWAACEAVEAYMERMRVSLADLNDERHRRRAERVEMGGLWRENEPEVLAREAIVPLREAPPKGKC
jgi:hypothetical protein